MEDESILNPNLENLIYEIRGQQVMLDSDLARLYQVETKRINEAVKNNPDKFPTRFSFVLSGTETGNLRSKISTANEFLRSKISTLEADNRGKHSKYAPRVFTEQGVYMLATILKSKVATKVSIAIMDAFVNMRHYLNFNKTLLPNRVLLLEERVDENTKKINELFDKFDPKVIAKDYLFFEGELYNAHSLLLDILGSAKNEIIIIDNYVDKKLLDVLKNIDKKIVVISRNIDKTLRQKYKSQYKNIVFVNNDSFHDRFIVIDKIKLYACGASFKDLGKKCFAIHEFGDGEYLDSLLGQIAI